MDLDPSTPANLPVTSDQERELLSSPTPESEGEPKKLGEAARKRLSRLLKSAFKQILEECEEKQLQERIRTRSEQAGTSKRIRSSDDSPEATATKPCTAVSKPNSGPLMRMLLRVSRFSPPRIPDNLLEGQSSGISSIRHFGWC
ncbi:hypothetical protein JTB14_013250 [Gonioctena quinquepunctata]|nr:hypothetical protein JTB14_013250 [Gonioctena quinquepunctata]